ncbi:hypothetical protein E3O47_07465 [Cryobacterium sp. TMT2-17-1]|uniref:hypothetical protein n=1 Tax=Cryobacterium sp. TMT2-17-1 TaxID=1259248 RepID=UPI00106AA8A5|nr:hypothetical protein [Cryobacterium sp. TMT2-17-1]TFC51559.1 hypothetical protein E3O47_07465 [Cryobacterium sp. TMT2-17-1]
MITNGSESEPTPLTADLPIGNTPVLLNRRVRPDARCWESSFDDDRWDITPGLFEEHAKGSSIPWHTFPEHWRPAAKKYLWHLINGEELNGVPSSNSERLSLRSIVFLRGRLETLVAWLDAVGIDDLAKFSPVQQELFLRHIVDMNCTHKMKQSLVSEFQRLWHYRDVLEAPLKMPPGRPWGGQRTKDLIGSVTKPSENLTARISDATLQPMLVWAFRFVDGFASDIAAGQRAWVDFDSRRHLRRGPMDRTDSGVLRAKVETYLSALIKKQEPLPGKNVEGETVIDLGHVAIRIGCRTESLGRYRDLMLSSGLPVEDGSFAVREVSGRLDGQSWLPTGLDYRDAASLARHLSTACFIVISYLSGMRPGEVLNLKRGCAYTNKKTGISTVRGMHFKAVTLPDGSANPEGEMRRDPWVVHQSVVRAIHTLEALHDCEFLFPRSLMPARFRAEFAVVEGKPRRTQSARVDTNLNSDIKAFSVWVNKYCELNSRPDSIPTDSRGAVTGRRFRRTLAWHIVRQPRGLVAAAIQYGHVHVSITQGYGGSADSGFADELAFESWLLKIETIADEQTQLDYGTVVSGPAAPEFKRRIADGDRRFAGRVSVTVRQAERLLQHPSLQVFSGRGMHCVMDVTTALCQVTPMGKTETMTPDIDDCRPRCQNIARTDSDIEQLRSDAARLEEVASDPLAPEIRASRERSQAQRLRAIIADHEGVKQ